MKHFQSTYLRGACLVLSLSACASGPPPAEWKLNARDALESASYAYLTGNQRLAESQFQLARKEIASSGKLDLMAKAQLTRCAQRIASLDFAACSEFEPLAQDASATERAYAAFLAGDWDKLKAEQLPAQHQAIFNAKTSPERLAALKAQNDALARLIQAALLLRQQQLMPEGIALAVESAAEQGWRRPLLAWLGVQQQRAQAMGDSALAAQVQRRMALVGEMPVDAVKK